MPAAGATNRVGQGQADAEGRAPALPRALGRGGAAVQLAAESKGIRLEVTLDPSARHVSGDAGRLRQVVWNLLSNAIKFTDEGGAVRVTRVRDLKLEVEDAGSPGKRPATEEPS